MSSIVNGDRTRSYILAGFGWAGTYYFLDPTSGIAAMIGTQLVPGVDPDLLALWAKLEATLYASLEEQ